MPPSTREQHVGIIGAGCAGLVLAQSLTPSSHHKVDLYEENEISKDHIWGYWDFGEDIFKLARTLSSAHWQKWDIITTEGGHRLEGMKCRYIALSAKRYKEHIKADLLQRDQFRFFSRRVTQCSSRYNADISLTDGSAETHQYTQIFDTARYTRQANSLIQHFVGHHVETSSDCFDSSAVTLMDFRVPQTDGLHFMYVLPFSKRTALVESTVFSSSPLSPQWYKDQIDAYLKRYYPGFKFTIADEESGQIPLSALREEFRDGTTPVGLAAGALRASSGFAFYQIHRQIAAMAKNNYSYAPPGATSIERWMDQVFLRVLRSSPDRGPEIFLRMARALSGDEFARFMNGHVSWRVKLKLILAMPKFLFLKALL